MASDILMAIDNVRAVSLDPKSQAETELTQPSFISPILSLHRVNPGDGSRQHLQLTIPRSLNIHLFPETVVTKVENNTYVIGFSGDQGTPEERHQYSQFSDAAQIYYIMLAKNTSQTTIARFEDILANMTDLVAVEEPKGERCLSDNSIPTAPLSDSKSTSMDAGSYDVKDRDHAHGSGSEYANEDEDETGKILLVDQEDGYVVGSVLDDVPKIETHDVKTREDDTVEIQVPEQHDGQSPVVISNVSPSSEYIESLTYASHEAFASSKLVQTSILASKVLMGGSEAIRKGLHRGSQLVIQRIQPAPEPVHFHPQTHRMARRVTTVTGTARDLSSKTLGCIHGGMQKAATKLTSSSPRRPASVDNGAGADTTPRPSTSTDAEPDKKPSIRVRGLVALDLLGSTVDTCTRNLVDSGGSAMTRVVSHKWGDEAGEMMKSAHGNVKNAVFVYVDAKGLTRKAVVKSFVKGAVVGKLRDGRDVVVQGKGEHPQGGGKDAGK